METPDTGGRVVIQLGSEPGSQGKQYMSSVYSRNENHIGNKHMLVSLQDYNLISAVLTAAACELPVWFPIMFPDSILFLHGDCFYSCVPHFHSPEYQIDSSNQTKPWLYSGCEWGICLLAVAGNQTLTFRILSGCCNNVHILLILALP